MLTQSISFAKLINCSYSFTQEHEVISLILTYLYYLWNIRIVGNLVALRVYLIS